MIRNSINEGISAGFRQSLAKECGKENPDERCPMRPKDGCACLVIRWENIPWWKRWFKQKPKVPSDKAVLDALISQRIDTYLQQSKH